MKEYHKIQTMWHRDPATKHRTLLEGQWSTPELAMLADSPIWTGTEKIDGTNIRVHWDGKMPMFGGRTDSAQIPTFLLDSLMQTFTTVRLLESLGDRGGVTLYGEGCGEKIQKVGAMYGAPQFVLFDVCAGGVWFDRERVNELAASIGVKSAVETVSGISLWEAKDIVAAGMDSDHGDGKAEGLVLRPYTELNSRLGERVITKLKTKDFRPR